MKKRVLAMGLAMAMTAGLLLSGCGNSKEGEKESGSKQDNITLTIASAMVTENPEGGLEQALADAYMKEHPNVNVEFISMPAPEISKRIVTMATGGNLPDLFFVPNDFMPQLYELEIVADLEKLMGQEWLNGCNQNLLRDIKINDKMMCVPWTTCPYAIIYRADWLKELKLEVPETWEEFREVAKAMTRDTDGDGKTDTWGFGMVGSRDNSGEQRFALLSKSFGADEIYQESDTWKTGIGSSEFEEALKFYTELYTEDGVVPPGPTEVNYSSSLELFATGQVGMIMTGPHSFGYILKNNPDLEGKLGSFVIPMKERHVSSSVVGGYTITTSCENPEVAADYVEFITSTENAIEFGKATGRMPVRTEAAADPAFSTEQYKGFLEAMDYVVEPKTFPKYTALLDTIGEAYSNILSGSAEFDDAYSTMIKKAEAVIEEQEE